MRQKDLDQARDLISALDRLDPYALRDAVADAFPRGPRWRAALDKSLEALDLAGFAREIMSEADRPM